MRSRGVAGVVILCLALTGCGEGDRSFKVLSPLMCPVAGVDDHVKVSSPNELHRGDVVVVRDPTKLSGENTPVTGDVITRIVAVLATSWPWNTID